MKRIILYVVVSIQLLSAPSNIFNYIKNSNPKLKDGEIEWLYNRIDKYSRQYNIDPYLIVAVMEKESSFDHETISSAGALGLMQIMPSTAKELGVNPKRAEENIEGGIRYLRQQLDKYEGRYKVHYALASYNAGAGAVRKYGGIPPYTETQNYIRKIVEKYNKLKQSENREVIGISGNEKSKLPIAEAGNIKERKTIIFNRIIPLDKKISFYKCE
ncbi:MAG: lytic transglycosylase domain-containing protein [Sebaldella sp.]|nr:lytic transglycosylase domain-containing protein [Sebaldella sp.]